MPPKVAINEAIELGKSFGGESSGKFVNGVLGTVYRELGEPGKEHPKRGEARLPDGQAVAPQQEDYIGAIVFRREGTAVQWAMIRDAFNHWTFVKGHWKPEESLEDGALRKVREEIGVGGRVVALLGKNSYSAKNEQREPVLRNVNYFLVETDETTLTTGENAGIVEAQWFPMEAVLKTRHYDDTNHIIEAAMEKITKGQ